jgi:hypothetical protein
VNYSDFSSYHYHGHVIFRFLGNRHSDDPVSPPGRRRADSLAPAIGRFGSLALALLVVARVRGAATVAACVGPVADIDRTGAAADGPSVAAVVTGCRCAAFLLIGRILVVSVKTGGWHG